MSYVFRKFQSETDVKKPFDCGNADLNGFLREKGSIEPNATNYGQEHLSVTYIVEDESSGEILAYFSLLNDKIERDVADSATWNRLSRLVPNDKRRSSYPALKIGRLAVSNSYQGSGLGRDIISFVQGWFYSNPRAGCRFLTVDALREAESFYTKCDFSRLVSPNPEDKTVLMFFDLKSIRA